ncbi:hypothetical protein [Variovorax sp. PBS-H4]|uniref:hypothetical protein n=1 Tax=Variovorax sp. PBS-H4 TaxID=434008 RepID=UPI0013A5B7F8|nr:hypothetical protein [Variovorax sp. PBS-H4]
MGDRSNRRVRRITPGGVVTTLAGSSTAGSADGIGADAQFRFIADVAVNATGDVYVISSGVIRKISPVR